MKTRAKFKCIEKISSEFNDNIQVNLEAVTTGSKENEEFWKYTPGGLITLTLDNSRAIDIFKIGQEYYVDFTLAEKKVEKDLEVTN